jgi:predicted nucleotidyltransferase
MSPVTAVDLAEATAAAVALSRRVGQPTVVAGALALAAHGYRRETSDVDIVVPVVIEALELTAVEMGLTVRAKHGFGGLDLRAGTVRIDVLTLDRDVPTLVPEAVEEAVASDRRATLFGHEVFVVSLGHLIAMKLVAERKKDIADIVELIKARLEAGEWSNDRAQVKAVVKEHLGWYAARAVDDLATTAKGELGTD